MANQIRFDPENTLGYGTWECPECGRQFYGGGPAMHNDGCSLAGGYEGVTYLYSKREREKLILGKRPAESPMFLLDEFQKQEAVDQPIVKNAVPCGICQASADRYANRFQCQNNPNHVGDLIVGIFSDLTPPCAEVKNED